MMAARWAAASPSASIADANGVLIDVIKPIPPSAAFLADYAPEAPISGR